MSKLLSRPSIRTLVGRRHSSVGGKKGPGAWPGQAGNPVGYNNTPPNAPNAFTTANGKIWPGAYNSLTAWPGGALVNTTIADGTYAQSGAGTAANPWVFSFYDFDTGVGDYYLTLNNAIFVGCRFATNDQNGGGHMSGANQTFVYCSFVPRPALYTSPPGLVWPSAGTGANTTVQTTGVNCIDGTKGCQSFAGIPSGAGPITFDHCDSWGFGNSFAQFDTVTAGLTFRDCWMHDCCNAAPNTYHQDGLGYLQGGAPPANVTIDHCTIASIGNTNAIALQAATSAYLNIRITNCYFSGFGQMLDLGHDIATNQNWTFTDNTIATDILWIYGPVGNGQIATMFDQSLGKNNIWRRNTLKVYPGTSSASNFVYGAGDNGKFVIPSGDQFNPVMVSTSDWAK